MSGKILLATTFIAVIAVGTAASAGSSSSATGMQSSSHVHGVMLRTVKDPKQALANDSVDDSSGTAIGHVQSVETYKSGHARAIMVSLSDGNKTVAIPQRDLRFDKSTNTLDAKLTKSQIEALSSHS